MYLVMQNNVRDYDDWKPVFDAGETVRRRHGCTGHEIFRGDDDANELTIMLEFPSREAGEAFLADPELKERMDEAGVLSKPLQARFRAFQISSHGQCCDHSAVGRPSKRVVASAAGRTSIKSSISKPLAQSRRIQSP